MIIVTEIDSISRYAAEFDALFEMKDGRKVMIPEIDMSVVSGHHLLAAASELCAQLVQSYWYSNEIVVSSVMRRDVLIMSLFHYLFWAVLQQ